MTGGCHQLRYQPSPAAGLEQAGATCSKPSSGCFGVSDAAGALVLPYLLQCSSSPPVVHSTTQQSALTLSPPACHQSPRRARRARPNERLAPVTLQVPGSGQPSGLCENVAFRWRPWLVWHWTEHWSRQAELGPVR